MQISGRKTSILATTIVLGLSACGTSGSANSSAGSLKAIDGSFTIVAPSGWKATTEAVPKPVVLVAQGAQKANQLLVSRFDRAKSAEDKAIFAVTGLIDRGTDCRRTKLDKRTVFDCAIKDGDTPLRKLFFPIVDKENSYLVFIQTQDATLADAAKTALPIIESIDFS